MTDSHDAIDAAQRIVDRARPAIEIAERVERWAPAFHLGDRMAKALEVAGVSRKEMASYMDVSTETLRRWTTMSSPIRKSTVRLWAMRTGVDLEWLETGLTPEELRARRDSNPKPSDMESGRRAHLTLVHSTGVRPILTPNRRTATAARAGLAVAQ